MKLAILVSLLASAAAFTTMPMARQTSMSTRLSLMTPEETETILTKAHDCAEGECGLDEVDELIAILQDQQKELHNRVQTIKDTIHALETVNKKDDRKVNEVRETVRAVFRIFQLGDKASGNDYPSLSKPTGYSGDVGKGPQTAYDAFYSPSKKSKASP